VTFVIDKATGKSKARCSKDTAHLVV